jgi:hypothetical protein
MQGMNKSSKAIIAALIFNTVAIGTGMAAEPSILADKKPEDQKNCASAKDEVARRFGTSLVPATKFKPYCLTGDFNGDHNVDAFMAVKIHSLPKNLAAIIPMYKTRPGERPNPDNYPAAGQYAYLALHSTRQNDWTGASIHLLGGSSPVMMMEPSSESGATMQKLPRHARLLRDLGVPASSKGDGIVVPTVAVDAAIFWDGKTYQFYEDPAGP